MNEYIEIVNQIKQKNNSDFPIADVNDLKGGYIQVDTISQMNSFLSTSKLKEGMLCYVKNVEDNIHMYQYTFGIWRAWSGGGGGGGGSGEGATILSVETLAELENEFLKIKGQLVFVNEVGDLRFYNGLFWESFTRIYIQAIAPEDKSAIWIDTSENNEFSDSNQVIKNLVQVISVLQEEVKRLKWAFQSQMDFGNFTNNKYYEYDNMPVVEPEYGTSLEEDEETASENMVDAISEIEPVEAKDIIPNGTHLCIKSGTYNEMIINQNDFLPKELLWCYDKKQLWIKDPNTLKLIQIGSSTEPIDDETMEQILTEVIGTGANTKTKITGIEFADMTNKNLTYLIQVKDGKLDVHDYRLDTKNLAGNAQVVGTGEYYTSPYFPILADQTGNTTSPMIYVNMVYCGADGGNKNYNPCSHNFIELCNLGNVDLNLKGLYLHYTERDTNMWVSLPLYGVIKSKGTFLIRGSQCSVMDVNTTYIKVSTYDMEWQKNITYNNSVLEINDEPHSIWDSNNLIKFSTSCAFYISAEESTDFYKTTVLQTSAPWSTLGAVKWYVDLVGIGSYVGPTETTIMPCELAPFAQTGTNVLLMRYYNMDHVSQAIKALSARTNSGDWTYINLNNINSSLNIEDYRPRASFENKDIFFNKHLLQEGVPNIITCSFGYNAHTTRCFNWVSVGYYDEYLWFTTESGTYLEENRVMSFKEGDGRASTNNRNHSIYNRIRSITTDGTPFTVHKLILDFPEPTLGTTQKYYYKVGREGFWSDERSFTMRNRQDVVTNGYNYLQVTDQQGFNGEEYEAWRLSAELINQDKNTNNYDFCVNTGDATQNGNRINEWIDYFKAGESIFKDTEQMYTVGNNDLCPLDVYTLGIGDDLSKTNPINVQYFFTFEHPYQIPQSSAGVYVPCVYSFVYGNTYFLSMNSEITEIATTSLFLDVDGGVQVYESIQGWCENDLLNLVSDSNIIWKVAFCHESPFTIITANTIMSYLIKDINNNYVKQPSVTRGGSHLNTVGNYWMSQFLQDNNFKLCMCGHKHTYSNSRYLREDPTLTMEPIVYDSTYIPAVGETPATYPSWYNALPIREKNCVQLSNNNTLNFVKYVMCQATGYKLTSNKELPAKNIPWLLSYYPVKTQTEDLNTNTAVVVAEPAQKFSHYIIWNIGAGIETENPEVNADSRNRIKGNPYKIVLTDTPPIAWAYKYNVPILLGSLSKTQANGTTNPTYNIIVEQTL